MHVSRFTMLIAEHRAPQYLLRAAGALASRRHGKAHGATLRRELINVPARIAHRGRDRVIVHLPR
ncbi:MAG: hypothetical protein LH603_13890, partial [Pseudonocardia sp.]|nr:hypothetical protein [Pseudonocardia sp.]